MPYPDLRQARQLRDALTPLYYDAPPQGLLTLLSDAVNDVLGGEATCFDVFSPAGQMHNLGGNAASLFTPRVVQQLAEHVHEHPLFAGIFVQRQDVPLKISDFCSNGQFARQNIFNDFYRPINIRHQLIVGFEVPGLGFTTCAISRSRRDFTEAERTLLAFAQPHLALLLGRAYRASTAPAGPLATLTPREAEVLRCLAQGLPDKLIASRCGISPRTVQVHLRNLYAKLGVDNRTAAALLAFNS